MAQTVGLESYQCFYMCISMWIKKGLAAMLDIMGSASVTLEVNLRNPLHIGLETQGRAHRKSKTGISVTLQKGLMSSKSF